MGRDSYDEAAEKALSHASSSRVRDFRLRGCYRKLAFASCLGNPWLIVRRSAAPGQYLNGLSSRPFGLHLRRKRRRPSMSQMYNEDLFEESKMSFGDHLEELRVCLFRAMIGLAFGFVIGLTVAGPVVTRIEGPLKDALVKYRQETVRLELDEAYGDVPEPLMEFMEREQLVFEELFIETAELSRVAAELAAVSTIENQANGLPIDKPADSSVADPSETRTTSEPGVPSTTMVKARVWRPMDANVTSLSAHEPFMIWIKAAVITGACIASPWIFYQIWSFVAAGLYPHEKDHVYFFLPVSLGLFFAGAALAFFFVFEPVLDFLFKFNRMMNIDPDPRISEWMSFVLFLPLGFGISFQLPLVMLIVERIGIVSIESFLEKWRIAVLIIFVISMLLTPADPISMLLMAVPLTLLYFGGIALCKYLPKKTSPYGEGYDP